MQMVTAPVKLVNIIDKTERRFKQLLGFCNMNLLFPLIIFFVCFTTHDSIRPRSAVLSTTAARQFRVRDRNQHVYYTHMHDSDNTVTTYVRTVGVHIRVRVHH